MNGRNPRVSVIVPSFNHGAFIEDCVASVLEAEADLELVVVDDGSTDDSVDRLRAIDDRRLRLVAQENRGAHAALNRGLDLCRGELCFVLNSDDRFDPRRIPLFLDCFDQDPAVAGLASWLQIVDADDQPLGIKKAWHNMPPWPRLADGSGLADLEDPRLALLESNYIATTSNIAFRTAGAPRFEPLRYTHDWELFLTLAILGPLQIIEEPLVAYRIHGKNTIAEGRSNQGIGQMRFEILWTVAAHAGRLVAQAAERGQGTRDQLAGRMWSSLPCFGHPDLLTQLLALRGTDPRIPPAYRSLLRADHTFRLRAAAVLARG